MFQIEIQFVGFLSIELNRMDRIFRYEVGEFGEKLIERRPTQRCRHAIGCCEVRPILEVLDDDESADGNRSHRDSPWWLSPRIAREGGLGRSRGLLPEPRAGEEFFRTLLRIAGRPWLENPMQSPFFLSLNGSWKFHWSVRPCSSARSFLRRRFRCQSLGGNSGAQQLAARGLRCAHLHRGRFAVFFRTGPAESAPPRESGWVI